jgi:pimeloyl-ACP methyl ester carboxylesterase
LKEIFIKTEDNIKIGLNHYSKNNENVVIIAPGWCMTKDSFAFKGISELFAENYDVICFDFRGHGKSSGFYTFMSKEISDMNAVIEFAKNNNYKNIYVAGFSLGAGVAVICGANNKNISKIIAVSAPYDFNKIENYMWKKEAWMETFRKFELGRFLSVRPSVILHKKIKPGEIIKQVTAPTLFIAGEKDPTVYPWHTEKLYNEAVCKKDYKLFQGGCHAEDLFLHFPELFGKYCLDWLKD